MSWANYDDVLNQLKDAGLDVHRLEVGTDKFVRCRVTGRDTQKRGWYRLYEIYLDGDDGERECYISGAFGVYQGSDPGSQKIKLRGATRRLSAEQKKAIAERHKAQAKQAAAAAKARQEKAAKRASAAWRKMLPSGESEYLKRKGVGAHGVRFSPNTAAITIPLTDAAGKVWGLQIVRDHPDKKRNQPGKQYWPAGLAVSGHYHVIGAITPGDVVLITEGYATGATLHETTGLPVVVAFSANNLQPVGLQIQKHFRCRILFCADDDYLTQGNPGRTYAESAAVAVDGRVVWPEFPDDRGGQKLTDFNDLANFPTGGSHLVRTQVEKALADAGWRRRVSAPPEPDQKGAGDRRMAVAVMGLDEAVERFLPVDDGTGKSLFDTWTKRICLKEQMVALLPPKVRWDDVKTHPLWTQRGAYYADEIGFDPTERDDSVRLNTWSGWKHKPSDKGSCEQMLMLLEYLCNGEKNGAEVNKWLLQWMAYPLQNPGAKMSSAVIMHGPQGTGKSAIFQSLAKIYGDYATILNQRGLEDKFNSDWVDKKLFVLAEEVVTRQEMWHIKNELKELVTGEFLRVNTKHAAAYRQRNHINIVYLSNEGQPLPIENDDRRHLVIWTPPALKQYVYDGLWQEIEEGGVAAFHHYLLNLDLSDFHPKKRPPFTQAKAELIQVSKASEDRFLDEWVEGETLWPVGPVASRDIYQAYLRWCSANGERFPRPSNQFLGNIKRRTGWRNQQYRVYDNCHYTGETKKLRMVVPAEEVLQSHTAMPKEDQTQAQWLTAHKFRFSLALKEV